MKHLMRLLPRGGLVVALGSALILLSSSVASAGTPPDKETGEHGHYIFAYPGAKCVYQQDHPKFIDKFVIYPPQLWWPDTNSDVDHQHGQVSWYAQLQQSTSGVGHWHTVSTTGTETGTAKETNGYPPDKAAKFHNMTITRHSSQQIWFRVKVTAKWPHLHGKVVHWVQLYDLGGGQSGQIGEACANGFYPS